MIVILRLAAITPNSGVLGGGGCILSSVIRIRTSHRTEALVDAFVANLTDERRRQGPFAPVRVIVPNRNVETYLRLEVCQRCGIAANLETGFLRRFLAGLAERAQAGLRVADAAHVEGHLLALLHDESVLAQPELAEVRNYLAAADGDRDGLDRRRGQLAAQLAQLFEEYAASRPDLLAAWTRDKPGPGQGQGQDGGHPTATWQRSLWLAIFGPAGRLSRSKTHAPLDALWSAAMAQRPAPLAGQSVHLFGLSYVAVAYHRMLAELARESEVWIYTLGPCREDAGALSSEAGNRAGQEDREDPFGLAGEAHLALRLWARPGRESLRLLAALPGATLTADQGIPRVPSGETLLRRLQCHIVNREMPAESAGARAASPNHSPDDSLRVLPCPSLRRELEVVAAEIWALAGKDPSLRLCDVAVIVPEASKELYLTQLSAVFRQSADLPHNVTDLPASAGHRVLTAIEHLLDLPFSSMSRKALLPLLTHPAVMARFPDATPAMWCELADQLGIVRGADRSDFHPQYPARDLFSWDQGLRRLTLGALGDGAGALASRPLLLGGEAYLPGPPIADHDSGRLGFGLLARSLLADARFAWRREQPPLRPLGQWLGFVRAMLESYLVLDEDDAAGRAVLAEFLRRLDDLAEVDQALGEQAVSYRIAVEMARRELGGLPWSHGRYLSSGVTVSSFVPMRAIPFRAVFLLGLGQGAFPRPAARSELDLRQGRRCAGDVDRREQDLYMFLETLLSARDQVVLSYVARDEVTGEELPASSVLLELRQVLGQGLLDQDGLEQVLGKDTHRRPPLRRYDDSPERRRVLPAAEAEHRARALGQRLRPSPYHPAPVAETVAGLPEQTRAALARVLGMPTLPEPAQASSGPMTIPLSALRRFLEDPLQGSARFRLGLRDEEDDGWADVEDERFDLENRERTALLSGSLSEALLEAQGAPSWDALRASYRQSALAAELAGRSPTGLFREAEAGRHEEALARWCEGLAERLGAGPVHITKLRLSPHAASAQESPESTPGGRGTRRPPLLRLSPRLCTPSTGDARTVEVHLTGQTGLCALSEATGHSLTFTWRAEVGDGLDKDDLRAFLDYVVLAATGPEELRAGHRSHLFYRSKRRTDVRGRALKPLSRRRALDYLADLCRELLASRGLHPYLLPHEAVLEGHAEGGAGLGPAICRAIERLRSDHDRKDTAFSSTRGPVPDVIAHYASPSPAEVERMVQARFGLFFELLELLELPEPLEAPALTEPEEGSR